MSEEKNPADDPGPGPSGNLPPTFHTPRKNQSAHPKVGSPSQKVRANRFFIKLFIINFAHFITSMLKQF